MRPKPGVEIEKCRITSGPTASDETFGNNGQFIIKGVLGWKLFVQVSDGLGWEHVSVSVISPSKHVARRCPTWEEMCQIKDTFWDEEECVVQYHPPRSDYVNCHPFVLHLFKPINTEIVRPPSILVGPKRDRHGR